MALPSVRLNTTVANLYDNYNIYGLFIAIIYCVFIYINLHFKFPRKTVYLEDEEPVSYNIDKQEIANLRKVILGLKPIKRVFAFGNLDVILFTPNTVIKNVKQVLDQLSLEQRPNLYFIDLN
jgi:hypothetical protein